PERDRAVLGRVVLVYMQVAFDLQRHGDERVAAELLDPVIEQAASRSDVVRATPVEVDLDADLPLAGIAADPSCTHGWRYIRNRCAGKHSALDRVARSRHLSTV